MQTKELIRAVCIESEHLCGTGCEEKLASLGIIPPRKHEASVVQRTFVLETALTFGTFRSGKQKYGQL